MLEIHSILASTVDLGIGSAVLDIYRADRHDLKLLALVQEKLKELNPQKKPGE